jgi:hypothetical protein
MVGGGLVLLSAAPPTMSQFSSSPWSTGSEEGISCDTRRLNCQSIVLIEKVLNYTSSGTHLLVSCLGDLQFLERAFPLHIVRLLRRRRNASFKTSRPLVDEWDVGQTRAAESGSQLEPLLKRLFILIVRGVFNGDGVVTLADFAALLYLALPLCQNIFKLWGRTDRR